MIEAVSFPAGDGAAIGGERESIAESVGAMDLLPGPADSPGMTPADLPSPGCGEGQG